MAAHLAGYDASSTGYPGPGHPRRRTASARWLDARRPATWTPGLIHGDFHFANVLIDPDEGAVAAIVDWELATDRRSAARPRPPPGHLARAGGHRWPFRAAGLPDRRRGHRPVRRAGSERSLDDVDWYQVLACYRLGIILEGTHARAAAGLAPKEVGDLLHAHTVSLFEQAHRLIDTVGP